MTLQEAHMFVHWWTESEDNPNRRTQTPKWTVKHIITEWLLFVHATDRPSFSGNNSLPSGCVLMVLQPLALCRTHNKQTDAHLCTISQLICTNIVQIVSMFITIILSHITDVDDDDDDAYFALLARRLLAVRSSHSHRFYSIHFHSSLFASFIFFLLSFIFKVRTMPEWKMDDFLLSICFAGDFLNVNRNRKSDMCFPCASENKFHC